MACALFEQVAVSAQHSSDLGLWFFKPEWDGVDLLYSWQPKVASHTTRPWIQRSCVARQTRHPNCHGMDFGRTELLKKLCWVRRLLSNFQLDNMNAMEVVTVVPTTGANQPCFWLPQRWMAGPVMCGDWGVCLPRRLGASHCSCETATWSTLCKRWEDQGPETCHTCRAFLSKHGGDPSAQPWRCCLDQHSRPSIGPRCPTSGKLRWRSVFVTLFLYCLLQVGLVLTLACLCVRARVCVCVCVCDCCTCTRFCFFSLHVVEACNNTRHCCCCRHRFFVKVSSMEPNLPFHG